MADRAWFDWEGAVVAVDAVRKYRDLTWKAVGSEAGIAPSSLSRFRGGDGLSVDSLVSIMGWAELRVDQFVVDGGEPDSLTGVLELMQRDETWTPEGRRAVLPILVEVYTQFKRLDESGHFHRQ